MHIAKRSDFAVGKVVQNMAKTIAAIATPQAAGGIGVIRISGDNARKVADKIFLSVSGAKLTDSKGYRAYFGHVYDDGQPIDEVVALVFAAPHSYTGEDVVELSCHGGLYVLQRVLRAVFAAGAVPAEAGEFTKRAFLNGRMDLTEAESVMGLIAAQGDAAARASLNAMEGALSRKMEEICQTLVSYAAHMSAWVDYPDEEIPDLQTEAILPDLKKSQKVLHDLLSKFDAGQAVTQGVDTAIVGRPNVGKSTLMNLLTGSQRSIVTSYAGTTRDIVEDTVRLGGLLLHLADTAGIRDTEDPVEQIGVKLARQRMERAGLVLAVFDSSEPLGEEDLELLQNCADKPCIAIVNKADLNTQLDLEEIKKFIPRVVMISAETGEGYDALADEVQQMLGTADFDPAAPMLATERQRECCVRAEESLVEAINAVELGMTMDAVNVSIDGAIEALLELTGQKAAEAVVNEVFAQFCVGK